MISDWFDMSFDKEKDDLNETNQKFMHGRYDVMLRFVICICPVRAIQQPLECNPLDLMRWLTSLHA